MILRIRLRRAVIRLASLACLFLHEAARQVFLHPISKWAGQVNTGRRVVFQKVSFGKSSPDALKKYMSLWISSKLDERIEQPFK